MPYSPAGGSCWGGGRCPPAGTLGNPSGPESETWVKADRTVVRCDLEAAGYHVTRLVMCVNFGSRVKLRVKLTRFPEKFGRTATCVLSFFSKPIRAWSGNRVRCLCAQHYSSQRNGAFQQRRDGGTFRDCRAQTHIAGSLFVVFPLCEDLLHLFSSLPS